MEIKIVELAPMTVASCQYVGGQPEDNAFKGLLDWATKNSRLGAGPHRFFGFNNPNPAEPGSTYGYEVWMPLDGKAEGSGAVRIKNVPGGTYAAVKSPSADGEGIMQGWKAFRPEMLPTGYVYDNSRPCLEQHLVDAARYPHFEDAPDFAVLLMTPVRAQ